MHACAVPQGSGLAGQPTYPEVVEGEVEVGESPSQWGQVRWLGEEVGLEAQSTASVHHAVHNGRLGRRYQGLVA